MIEAILYLLRKSNNIDDFIIHEHHIDRYEWYLLGNKLDMTREVELSEFLITIFTDDGPVGNKTRGRSMIMLHGNMGQEEIKESILRGIASAKAAKNPWYPIPLPSTSKVKDPISSFNSIGHIPAMKNIKEALYRFDNQFGARINSSEIFLSKIKNRLINSRGVDLSCYVWSGMVEYIVNAGERGSNEIELYSMVEFSDIDKQTLSSKVIKQMDHAVDRLKAVPTPSLNQIPLILADEIASEIYRYWYYNALASFVYNDTNIFSINDNVFNGNMQSKGDMINLSLVPEVEGSPLNIPFDHYGLVLKRVNIIDNNILKALIADSMYAHYLNIQPTGNMKLYEFNGGPASLSEKELRFCDHIEIASFSDFFLNPTTGDFGGEIRLGYLSINGRKTPVTGGSMTGCIKNNSGKIKFSRELVNMNTCRAPKVCLVPFIDIAPAG